MATPLRFVSFRTGRQAHNRQKSKRIRTLNNMPKNNNKKPKKNLGTGTKDQQYVLHILRLGVRRVAFSSPPLSLPNRNHGRKIAASKRLG